MVNARIEARAQSCGVTLSGSVIAVPQDCREALARELISRGNWVHADVIGGRYLGQPGVSMTELGPLLSIAGERLDVHLMVDDPEVVLAQLPPGLGRITVQWDSQTGSAEELSRVVAAARALAQEVWVAVDPGAVSSLDWVVDGSASSASSSAGVDGVLVMLIAPGLPGMAAEPTRLKWAAEADARGVSAGVDGGVNEDLFELLEEAGVRYAVVGRALVEA